MRREPDRRLRAAGGPAASPGKPFLTTFVAIAKVTSPKARRSWRHRRKAFDFKGLACTPGRPASTGGKKTKKVYPELLANIHSTQKAIDRIRHAPRQHQPGMRHRQFEVVGQAGHFRLGHADGAVVGPFQVGEQPADAQRRRAGDGREFAIARQVSRPASSNSARGRPTVSARGCPPCGGPRPSRSADCRAARLGRRVTRRPIRPASSE